MYKRKGMQYFLSWVVVICCGTNLIAQTRHNYNKYIIDESLTVGKRVINLNTLDTVARRDRISDVSDFAAISPDGNYCSFVIKGSEDYTSVQSTKSDWTRKLSGVRPGFFSGDNQYYIYQSGDSLCYLSLKKGALTVIKDVVSYQSSDRRNEWLAIELKNKTLLLRNIVTGIQKQFKDVSNYAFSKSGDWFSCQLNNEVKELFTTQLSTWETHSYQHVKRYRFGENPRVLILETDEGGEKKLQWVNSLSGKKTIVWTSANNEESSVISYSMNQSTTGLVFIIQSVLNDKIKRSVWYYREGMLKAVEKEFHNIPGMMEQLEITEATVTDNGRYIIVSMHEPTMAAPAPNQDAVKVDVWNYKDTILMSSQLLGDAPGLNDWLKQKVFKFSLPSEGEGSLTYLSGAYEQLFMPEGDYALLGTDVGTDRFWENWASGKSAQFLISLRNGKRNCLREGITFTRFSPDGSWLLCYDSKMGQYLRYDIDVGL
ncbi:MAG: hypothetical protein J7497_00430 [Chitinophagaceae bacterium]|nr:hypothetical protein [Chitinophagaceae bacterium]